MTDNVYLNIAQEKGLIDQDDYQGWRLTAKGERFLSLILDDEGRGEYRRASDRLFNGLGWDRAWTVTNWFGACLGDHPGRIKVQIFGSIPFTFWVDVDQVTDERYDIAQIIAGQYEAALRQAVEA